VSGVTGPTGPTAGLDADVRLQLGDLDLAAQLRVAPGETLAVLGPNGAGKTTLLRAMAGLLRLDAGHVAIDGNPVDDPATAIFVGPEHRSVSVVFQDYLLFPHLNIVDNVAFGLRCHGERAKPARQEAMAWLQRVGLQQHADARPAQLSGGQAQRAALARALVTAPRVLLLDEPLAALDAAMRATTRRDLVRHLREHDGMRVVVTHDPVEAAALADRLVVLEEGRVVQEGALAELTAHPRSRYVAELVGVNLLTGHARNGTVTVTGATATMATTALTIADTAITGDVLAVIPPHAVALHRRAPEGTPRNVWQTTVAAVDDGATGRGRARVLLSPPLAIVAEVTSTAIEELGLAEGTPVWASVKATEIRAFEA